MSNSGGCGNFHIGLPKAGTWEQEKQPRSQAMEPGNTEKPERGNEEKSSIIDLTMPP